MKITVEPELGESVRQVELRAQAVANLTREPVTVLINDVQLVLQPRDYIPTTGTPEAECLHADDRCCYKHRYHVEPHRGCILR